MIDRRRPESRRNRSERRTSDRRDGSRMPAETAIRFMRSGAASGAILHGVLQDVSPRGLRIAFDETLDIGEKLLVEVRGEDGRCFNATVEAVRIVASDDDRNHVGCEFSVAPSRKQIATLKKLATDAATDHARLCD